MPDELPERVDRSLKDKITGFVVKSEVNVPEKRMLSKGQKVVS